MLYKLQEGRPEPFTGMYIKYNGLIYSNPTDEQLKAAGYKPLITAKPPDEREGYYIIDTYTETNKEIIQVWTEVEIKEEAEV